jgi:hypothetical protein
MAQESASPFDPSQLAAELELRAEQERAEGGYPDDLSGFELVVLRADDLDLR